MSLFNGFQKYTHKNWFKFVTSNKKKKKKKEKDAKIFNVIPINLAKYTKPPININLSFWCSYKKIIS